MSKSFLFISLGAVLLLSASCSHSPAASLPTAPYNHKMKINDSVLWVDIADTEIKQAQGLSGRQRLAQNQGMLFEFGPTLTRPEFWMKDMGFDLDFVWIQQNKIIGITKNVPAPAAGTPDSELKLYNPPVAVNEVVEVDAGWAESNHIKIGDEARLIDDSQ